MGGASRHTYGATFPPDRFYCLLDELPLHLIPQRGRRALVAGDHVQTSHQDFQQQILFLNPECVLLSGGETPQQFQCRRDLLAGFAQQGTIAWVRDAAAGTVLPFWLGPRLESALRNLRTGEPAAASLDAADRAVLVAAGILTAAEHANRRSEEWEDLARKSGPLFRERSYAPLPSLIHPFHVAALRRYYRFLIRTGAICLGDGQSSRRYVAYNEPVARFFHHSLAPLLSTLAGELLKPSYVYLASYLSGAELKKHTDREQCEFSITFCLDFSPEPALATPWPIRLDTDGGRVAVYQALGDGLAYRGTRLPHYRDALGRGQTSTSIFFHYVSADFAGSLD